jgi:hypothetical protein
LEIRPAGEPGKNFEIFSKRRLTLRELLAISPSPLMGTELIGSRSFHRQQGAARPKPSRSLRARKERTKIFEILTLKDNQRVTTKIELWVIVSSFLCDKPAARPELRAIQHRAGILSEFGRRPLSRAGVPQAFNGEFDSGSERTLAAWIRHASRTGLFFVAIQRKV